MKISTIKANSASASRNNSWILAMNWKTTLGLVFVLASARTGNAWRGTNYCALAKCGSQHIACNNTGHLGPLCPANTQVVDLSTYKELIVLLHNEMRDLVAGGHRAPFRPAARMALMSWDEELAQLAQMNANRCKLEFDSCRSTERFHYSGQNTAIYSYVLQKKTIPTIWLVKHRIEAWFHGIHNITMAEVRRYPEGDDLFDTRPFTVIVTEKNTHVGCGAVTYRENDFQRFLMTCNYASNNIVGQPIYVESPEPGQACKTGISVAYYNLCSADEEYDTRNPITF